MSSRPPARTAQARIRRALVRGRVVVYLVLLGLVVYHAWRYDLVTLPAEGSSPLVDVHPGSRLLVDLHPGRIEPGSAVLYRGEADELLLGRVDRPPSSAPVEVWEAWERGALWVVKDRADVPGADSLLLGALERDRIVGRIVTSF